MKRKIIFCNILTLIFSSPIYSAPENRQTPCTPINCFGLFSFSPVIALSGGMNFLSQNNDTINFTVDGASFSFKNNQSTNINGLFGFFVGGLIPMEAWKLQAGVGYYLNFLTPEGTLTQGVDAQSADRFNYSYDITSHQFLFETKLSHDWCNHFHPYVSAGIGFAVNTANNYYVNNPIFLTFVPQFEDNTKTSFSYNVGLGVDFDIGCHWQFGIGYRFTDLGETKLGSGNINTIPLSGTLSQEHTYVHELLGQFTFSF